MAFRMVKAELPTTPVTAELGRNKTLAWQETVPKFIASRCNGCGDCATYCPEAVITDVRVGSIKIELDYCKGCGICADVCLKRAIKMVKA